MSDINNTLVGELLKRVKELEAANTGLLWRMAQLENNYNYKASEQMQNDLGRAILNILDNKQDVVDENNVH